LDQPREDGRLASSDYAPVFSFVAADGETYTVTSVLSTSLPKFSVGDKVRVLYDPTNPNTAKIRSFFQLWGGAVIAGIIALIFFGVGFKLIGFLIRR
jgi:hypothetical protein